MKTVLKIENVSKSYQLGKLEVPVLHDINLEVQEGEFAGGNGTIRKRQEHTHERP